MSRHNLPPHPVRAADTVDASAAVEEVAAFLPTPLGRSHVAVSRALQEALERTGRVVSVDGTLYQYRGGRGVWEPLSDTYLSSIVQRFDGKPYQAIGDDEPGTLSVSAAAVSGAIRLLHDRVDEPGFWDGQAVGMVFLDCALVRSGDTLEEVEHSADHRFRHRYNCTLRQAMVADAPLWASQTLRICRGDADVAAMLQFYIGACVLGLATKMQRVLVLSGAGDNGKSTWVEALEVCAFPSGSVKQITPHLLGERFGGMDELEDALLAINTDIPKHALGTAAAANWKAVITGDKVRADRKNRDALMFKPRAGWLMSANRLPKVSDSTLGFWRRMLVIPTADPIAAAEKDETFPERLRAERNGVIGWVVQGARLALAARFKITVPDAVRAATEDWQGDSEWNPDADALAGLVTSHRVKQHNGQRYIIPEDVYLALFGKRTGEVIQPEANRATAAMATLGWVKRQIRVGKQRPSVYRYEGPEG